MKRKTNQRLIIRQSSVLLSFVVLLSIYACATPGLQDNQLGLTHLRKGSWGVNNDLLKASYDGNLMDVKSSIISGANVNAKDEYGRTALTKAAHRGHVEIVRLLIEKGADINAVENDGYSVLTVTESMPFPKQLEIVKLLINEGADVNARSNKGWTALMEAAKGHLYSTKKSLLDQGHKDVAMVPTEFAKLLIERGSDVNAKDVSGETALMVAANRGQTETIKLLIEKGANVNAKRKDGVTALMIAASAGINEIVSLLIEKGVDINAKANNGFTAFYYAATNGHTDIAKLLKQAGGGPVSSPLFSVKERLRFEGFSILPPESNNWSSMDSDTKGIIFERRYTGKKIHSIIASARIKEYTDLTIKDRLELLQYVKEKIIKVDYKDARFKPIDIKVSSECHLGGDCVRYDFTIEDHGAPRSPGSILILTGYGFFFVHPDARYIVDINYSQRFPKDDKPLPVEVEVEPFFKSLEFTPIKQKR